MQTHRAVGHARQIRAAISIVWNSSPQWTIANAGLVVVQSLLPLASLYLMKLVLDAVTERLRSGDPAADFAPVVLLIGLAGLVSLFNAATQSASRLVNEAQGEIVTDYVHDILHAKSVEVDLEYYENAEYYDKLHRAQREALYRPIQVVTQLMQLGQSSLSLLAVVGLLLPLHWGVALLLFLTALPGVLVRLHFADQLFRWRRHSTPAERQAWYYDWMLTSSETAKEIRLFNLGPVFIDRFRAIRRQLRRERLSLSRRRSLVEFVTQLSGTVALFGSYAFITYRALQGAITLGDLVMYYQAFLRGQAFLADLLRSLAGLYEDSLFLVYLDEFLNLKPHITAPSNPQPIPQPLRTGLAFRDVSFTYPGSTTEALSHINLTICPGQVVALVGENGAGKTTVVKLLCRLYDPGQGTITLDEIDVREFDPLALRRKIGVLFQDYLHYNATVQENIWYGNADLPPDSPLIWTAAQQAGVDRLIARLPHGEATILGKMYQDGEELSIGQWQKIALARAFLRDAPIVILDEPTSALDALAEHELLVGFRELVGQRSALLISHRLSSVKMADYIYVLDNHTIAEHGTHADLMQQDGIYARLFRAQAENYR